MLSLYHLWRTTTTPIWNDAPEPWQIYFQDSATPTMEGIVELNDQISFYLIVILVFISWMLSTIVYSFSCANNKIKYKYENHGLSAYLLFTREQKQSGKIIDLDGWGQRRGLRLASGSPTANRNTRDFYIGPSGPFN
jgi:hypothetical protein